MPDSNETNQTTGAPLDDETNQQTTFNPADIGADPGMDDTTGTRIETFISPRTFVSQEWCLQNIASKPRGHHVTIGRIAGYAVASERRDSAMPVKPGDKPMPASVWIKGEFEAVVLTTGELKSARWLILPRAAGELVEQAFQDGAERAFLDLELGVEATGRSIPYAYTVTTYGGRDNEARRMVKAIRARQEARALTRERAPLALISGAAKKETV